MEEYYYNHMNKIEKSVYFAMKTGIKALSHSFTIPKMEGKGLTDIFFKLRLDHPEIFYAVGFRFRFYEESSHMEMIPEYLFDQGKIKEHQKAMAARIEKLIRPAREMKELEKECYIHDFICTQVVYDKLKKPYSHEVIGSLGHGVGVCEGIAKTVKILCDALGIWCMIAISDANPDKKIKYRHAWNIIQIGGVYYHLDATFDNTLGCDKVVRYDYFNLDDKSFFRDHEPTMYEVPPCPEGHHFYYIEKKQSFTKKEELLKRATQAMKKRRVFIFHYRSGYLTRVVMEEIMDGLKDVAKTKSMYPKVSVNWGQSVFQVSFHKVAPVNECVVEDIGLE